MSQKTPKKSRSSFGATAPPFIDYLKDILRRYPDGGQILKELIQNADDARATEVIFIHDERSYGTKSLWNEELGKYQGPALYAYNNAAFTDDDWEGIQMAGRSVKRNDPNKVGRFGIGFNSVYHTTDMPGIFSSVHLGLMDPQEKIFGPRNGGFRWSLDDPEHQHALMSMHDQFQPFRDIVSLVKHDWAKVVTEDQYFDGTIFRFPLRNEESEISDNLYNSDRVVELFDSFIADADLSLLFLKNVMSVSLIHVDVHGSVNTRLTVTSSNQSDTVLKSDDNSVTEGSTNFKVISLHSDVHRETKWLVTSCTMKEGNLENLDSLAKKLSFFPQVDLAFPCDEDRDCLESRLSCFLPLPNNESNKTGLPVYVNACFGLTDNRRHIKWQEEDQKHDEHAVWNELLMKEVLPHAYLRIIQDAIILAQQSLLPVPIVYNLWPDTAQIRHKEKWYSVAQDVLSNLFRENVAALSLAKDERRFITPSEAVFPCNGPTRPEILAAIEQTLVSCGENLVTLPRHVAQAIKEACPYLNTLKHVTPAFVRDTLHKIGMHGISKDDKIYLLEYVLSDGNYGELEGLQLLPLSDGSFRCFSEGEEDTALIDSIGFPRTLLPFCKDLFIPDDLSPTCVDHLKMLARTNLYKVIDTDAHHVAEYMRRYLPEDWKETRNGVVAWDTSSSQHPPFMWLQEFWKFLSNHYKELSCFTGIPLIPVSSLIDSQVVSLARLKQNTTLIFQTDRNTELPNQIAMLVNKAGGTVVTENKWLKHIDLESYVLRPSPASVMRVLVNLDSKHLVKKLKAAPHTAREALKDYLSHLDALACSEKDLLLKLPLFQTMNGVCSEAQSKQAVLLVSDLKVPTELPMPDSVVQCVTEADRRLLQLLNVKLLNTAEAATLLINCIENRSCSEDDIEKIMTWILQHGSVLFSQNVALKHRCKSLRFIKMNGELRKASSFFDPRVHSFAVIFESDFFPPHSYSGTSEMLKSLTDLGLMNKEADVSPQHLLHAAMLIDRMHAVSPNEAHQRAQVLIKILDANDLLPKFTREQLEHLKMLKWLPCNRPANDNSEKSCFFCPNEIRHSVFKDLVGYVMPLGENISDKVSNKLGLKCRPPPKKVIENLLVLIAKAQGMADPDTDVDFKRELNCIYRHMQEHISEYAPKMNTDTCWLWNYDQFVSPKDLVLDYPRHLDLSSYIGKVPKEFLSYKKLLKALGLKTLISDEEIVCILHSIQQNCEGRQQPYASSSEVKVSIEILNWLRKQKKVVEEDIPVPVILEGEQYTLKPKSTAVFSDISKSGLKEFGYSQEQIHILHEEIPKATAEWLNIQFLSTFILDPELVGIEQCGQSEPITTRIKNILKEYDEESDIFKELIQNAEDAGAEVCKFLLDFRVHKDGPESLIDPGMALCQGPCLWAFNNEQFTAKDWSNIVRVGAASKENQVEKIGKFGLGFNTVYHVTDVPSILSGNNLLILDPNVSHLKKHIKHKTNPGIKLDLSQHRLFRCFPGQFEPYERIFDCSFTEQNPPEPYPGTLIKLPFRTAEEALQSEISTKVYQKENIVTFQQHLTENSQTHLLFLRKVSALSLQSISNNGSTPPRDDEIETIFTVSKTTLSTAKLPEESVSKQHQAEKRLMKLDTKCKEIIDCCAIGIVEITSQHNGMAEVQFWLQYNCFGSCESMEMALQDNKHVKFSLPIGGIAVPLQKNPKTGNLQPLQTNLVGQAFCFLPLSIRTGLPVNVNGTFAVTSNRKGLWESGVKRDWNTALLQDAVLTAYVTALLTLKKMSQDKKLEGYCYHTFWPDRDKVSETFTPLVDAFYTNIAQNSTGPELFTDGEHWCSLDNAIFLHESIEEDEAMNALVVQVCKKYANPINHVVHLPLWLKNNFKRARLEHVLQGRTWNWERFYQEVVFNNLSTLDPGIRDVLVLHAIDLHIKEIDKLLVQFPCIPTRGGHLQFINKLVNPSGKVACLFAPEEGRLLGGTENDYCSPKRIQRLLVLGMTSEHLSLEDITEKAGTISQTWCTDRGKAYEQLKCLLELLKDHMDDEESVHWETLRMTEFMPVFPPANINVKQTKQCKETMLRKPTDVFTDKCSLLVNMTWPVLDHGNLKIHNTDPVLQILGLHDSPKPETVLQQLKKASELSQSIDKSMLLKIASECYKFLDQWLTDGGDPSIVSETANSFPFILVGSTFENVSCCAENEQFEAKPYLHILPPSFIIYKKLWESVGVAKHFTVSQCLNVLQELHSRHTNRALPKCDLQMCLTILTKGIFESEVKTSDCLMPNEHGVLQPASQMRYNDSPWMPVAADITLCHKYFSRAMVRHFGIKTTRHHTLQSYAAENIAPFAFHFEQHEKLTVRIKNIISAYPSKKDILKELIQNADDAEATEIHFVWDKRQHGKEKTFGKKWNHLQGPALCVFNNKVFSDTDLAGIQQLGEGGKHSSLGKTGKYGVGFNSVYHLTDCPSILTGDELLCISDPNQKYIESPADKPPAGMGYKLADTFKDMYMDVYRTFLPDKFSLKDGTMFRLPLRMGTLANSSEISKQGITDSDMKELCSALQEDPEGLVLFLKNICKIHVHEINEESEQLKTIFVVEKTVPETSQERRDAFLKLQQNALQSAARAAPQNVIYDLLISTSDKKQSKWVIAEQFGSFAKGEEKEMSSDKLPRAAIAACISPRQPSSMEFKGEAFCSLPLPGKTGLPVHINANFEVDSSRRSLWKEDGQSQKMKWNDFLKQRAIAPLYADLLQHMSHKVAKTKVTISFIESCFNSRYLCFWPIVSKDVDADWHELIHEVYRSVKEKGLNVIPLIRTSVRDTAGRKITEYSFDWCDVRKTGITEAPYLLPMQSPIKHILEELGMNLVPFSCKMQDIWKGFKSAGIELKDVSPSNVRTFLKEKPLNDPAETNKALPLPIDSTLIRDETICSRLLQFCLNDLTINKLTEKDSSLLDGLPLLLTRDKVLRVFNSKSPKLISRYDSLFLHDMDKFADYKVNEEYKETLEKLKLLKKLTVASAADYLKPLIQHHLQECEVDSHSGLYVPNETMLKWLNSLWKFLESEIKLVNSDIDKQSVTFSDVKRLFHDCYILPVVCPRLNDKHLLQRMKDMSSVVQFASSMDISGILFKLGFMKLNTKFFSETHTANRQLTLHLHPELMDVKDTTAVLDQVYRINHSEVSKLSNEDKGELQTFLQAGAAKAQNKQDFQMKFKSLPLFETVFGERVRIDGPNEVFVFQSRHLTRYPDLLQVPKNNCIFLKDNVDNLTLSECLRIPKLTDLEYFMKFILPIVHGLTERQMLHCFQLLLSLQYDFSYSENEKIIISSLKKLKWIRNSQDRLEAASYYYDKRIAIFEKMIPAEKFVPENFWREFGEDNRDRMQKLLRELGMKHDVSKEDIINFACQIQTDAKRNDRPLDLKEKSLLLFRTVLIESSKSNSKKGELLKSIADINFLFPDVIRKELRDYHKPFADETMAVKIKGSLMSTHSKNQDLIWSSMPIISLPVHPSEKLLEIMKDAGAHEEPPLKRVADNLSNICQSPCKTDELIKTRACVFRNSYAYLQAHEFDGQSLAGLPVVLVEKDKELAKTNDTTLSLNYAHDFRPYLHEIQSKDVIYKDFFTKTGVEQNPTVVHFCNVLASVYSETCDKKQLQPNQLKTVRRAVEQLFRALQHNKKQSPLDKVKSLHLLAVDGKLHPSCDLYYNDTVFEVKRFEEALDNKLLLLEKLSICHLGEDPYAHKRFLMLLPPHLQPKMLSEFTEEKVVEVHLLPCELKSECEFRGWFDEHLSSSAFQHGLICLIRHDSDGQTSHEDAVILCQKTFGRIEIVCCENMETVLWLNGQPLPNTASDTEVFVKRVQNGCTFYLRHDDMNLKVVSEICKTLTQGIIDLSGNKISQKHSSVLEQLILCDNLQDVQKLLAKKGIHDSGEARSLHRKPPEPGTEVPEEWHDSLDMDVLNNFEVDEYVGYSIEPPKYIYAIIVEELPGSHGQYSQRYKVDIGEDEPIEVSCLDLYQFKREKKPKPGKTGTSAENHCMELEPLAGAVPHQSSQSSSTPSSSSTGSFPTSLDEIKREIDKSLAEIWTLPDEVSRKKAIRRLYLRWHPDKNPDFEDLATEACKYLQNRYEEYRTGKTQGSSSSQGNADFRNFYKQWNQEARYHRQSRENFSRRYNSYNFWSHNENIPRPDKKEGQRWCRQARCDLNAAHRDTGGNSTEWCLFKVHQAVEKALKAAMYKRDGQHCNTSSSITALASQVSCYSVQLRVLPEIVNYLKSLGVDAKKTQYPNCHPCPHIPNGQFPTENEMRAINKASELLSLIETYVD